MTNITNKNLLRMKELMGKTPINESITTSAVELVKKSPNGKSYGIVRENRKYFIKESNDGINFDFIGGVGNKQKNQHSSYEDAIKELNFMFEDFNRSYNIQEGTNILTNDIIEEKRFILKSKKKKSVDFGGGEDKPADTGFDFGGEDKGGDDSFDFGGGEEGGDDNAGFDFGGGEDESGDSGDFDFGDTEDTGDDDFNFDDEEIDDDDPIKSIQKMTGKLGQKIRDTEDLSSDTMKWVAKSVISALDLEAMDSEDKKDIIRAVKKKEAEGTDEGDFDFMDDPEDDEDDDLLSPLVFMDEDDSDTVVWDNLTPEEKQSIVQSFPGDTEEPIMDWDAEVDDSYDPNDDFRKGTDPQYMMFPPEETYQDYMREDNPDIGGDEDDQNLLFDEELPVEPYDEDEEDEFDDNDWMSDYMGNGLNDETYPYREVNDDTDYMDGEELYGPGDNHVNGDEEIIDDSVYDTVKKMKAGNSDLGNVEKLLMYVKRKIGKGVNIDNNMIVGDNYFIFIEGGRFIVEKGNTKKKVFNFDKIGDMVKYVKSKTDNMTDYMSDPRMMPAPAPAQPTTKPGPDVKPGRPDTDKPSPSKRPFTPPPHIRPGEEPNPKAEYEDYGSNEGMDFMDDKTSYEGKSDSELLDVIFSKKSESNTNTQGSSDREQMKKDLVDKYLNRNVNNGIDYMGDDDTCTTCKGTGHEKPSMGFGMSNSKEAGTCKTCKGTGTNNPFPYTTDSTLTNDNVKLKYSYRDRDRVDYMGDNDEISNKRNKSMRNPAPAPARPETRPDVKPGKPDTDKPSPSKKPFTPPPHIRPGEEPNPKARGRNRY